MTKLLVGLALFLAASVSHAGCVGSAQFPQSRKCTDDSGNSYTVTRKPNSTIKSGYNARDGTTWSESAHVIGDTTYINGSSSDGRTWSEEIRIGPSGVLHHGVDSQGRFFSATCAPNGCR